MYNIKCKACGKEYKYLKCYIKHVELKHTNNCQCPQDGGAKKIRIKKEKYPVPNPIPKKKMNKIFINADDKIKSIEKNIALESLLTDKSQNTFKMLPIYMQNRLRKLLLENEYLKGMIKSKNLQIKELQKNINKCIDNIGQYYTLKSK